MPKAQHQQKPSSSSPEDQYNTQLQGNQQYNSRSIENGSKTYNRRPKYQEKENRYKNKFGFDYDQSKIGYNTEIPEMPQKPKQKPDESKYNKKVQQLQKKAQDLKKLRKEKKNSSKHGSKVYRDKIEEQQNNIELAKACLVLLSYDKKENQNFLQDTEAKINKHKKKIEFLSKQTHKKKKNIEEMSLNELLKEQERIQQQMSTLKLTKAEQVELSYRLNKINKSKIEASKNSNPTESEQTVEKSEQIYFHKQQIQKYKNAREYLEGKLAIIENKMSSIKESITEFQEIIKANQVKINNTDNSALLEEAAKLKEQILRIEDEIRELEDQHKNKIHQYEHEQQKIKYIQWAKEIKVRKTEEWELEKQQRKRQKLKEKQHKKKEQKDDKPTKQGQKAQPDTKQQKVPRVINRNQKEIDSCSFLIQYCKDLREGTKQEEKKIPEKEPNLEEALKQGEWGHMRNVEVIKPKKSKIDEQIEPKTFKKRENKHPIIQTSDRFSHTYFVAQVFDSVKVLPPAKTQDLEKVINELQDKLEYYLAHPNEVLEKTLLPTKQEIGRQTKTKFKRLINTEEFPALKQ